MPNKILLIEDNEGDIFLIKEAFKETNFEGEITELKDGDAAIDYFLRKNAGHEDLTVNLILLDVNLPKRNGHEVLKFIKNTPYLKRIPVVIFTTSSAKSDIQQAYENAANSFITKPVDTDDFQKVIAEIQSYWFSVTQLSV